MLDQMEDLGYETHNAILNLGSLFIFGSLYILKVILYFIAKVFCFITGVQIKGLDKFGQRLFFNEVLAIVLEAYIEWIISGYLNYVSQDFSVDGERIGVILGYVCLAVVILVIPLVLIYVYTLDL